MVLLSWAFAFKKHERSEFIVAFGGFGACPPEQGHGVGIYHGSEKYPLCILAYFFLNLWFLSLRLKKLPLD